MKKIWLGWLAACMLVYGEGGTDTEIDIVIEKFRQAPYHQKCKLFEKLKKMIVKMNMDEQYRTLSRYEQKTQKKEKKRCPSFSDQP